MSIADDYSMKARRPAPVTGSGPRRGTRRADAGFASGLRDRQREARIRSGLVVGRQPVRGDAYAELDRVHLADRHGTAVAAGHAARGAMDPAVTRVVQAERLAVADAGGQRGD